MEGNFPNSTYNGKSSTVEKNHYCDGPVLTIDSIRKKSNNSYNRNLRVHTTTYLHMVWYVVAKHSGIFIALFHIQMSCFIGTYCETVGEILSEIA